MDKDKPAASKEEKEIAVEFKTDKAIAEKIFYNNYEIFMMTRGHW